MPQGSVLEPPRSIVEPTDLKVRKTAPSPRGNPEKTSARADVSPAMRNAPAEVAPASDRGPGEAPARARADVPPHSRRPRVAGVAGLPRSAAPAVDPRCREGVPTQVAAADPRCPEPAPTPGSLECPHAPGRGCGARRG